MAKDKLSRAIREAEARLVAEWGRTTDVWRDEVATRFAREFWEPLERSISQYLNAVEALEGALNEAEREERL
jgi:hypothetical protein